MPYDKDQHLASARALIKEQQAELAALRESRDNHNTLYQTEQSWRIKAEAELTALREKNETLLRGINFIAAMDVRTHHISDPIKMARNTLCVVQGESE